MKQSKRVLLIISGGIAAYKSILLIRQLKQRNIETRVVLTKGGSEFVTPLTLSAISEDRVFQDLFDLTTENEIGHIRLSRECDLVVVCPATADIMAKMAHGLADDLASTVLLASDKPVLVVPAMNPEMWGHPATQANLATLKSRGVAFVGPEAGMMACGEVGAGRVSEPEDVADAIEMALAPKPLAGRQALVTAGPTHEAIDPVRYIANSSSGKQGYAIAAMLARAGADVKLVSGPTRLDTPPGVTRIDVKSARDMEAAVQANLPNDIAIFAAAVADWRPANPADQKLKKKNKVDAPTLETTPNPDILAGVCKLQQNRPSLIVGFAAETQNIEENAIAKKARKGCDWLLANDVSPASGTFGGDTNRILFLGSNGTKPQWWDHMSKSAVADQLIAMLADHFHAYDKC